MTAGGLFTARSLWRLFFIQLGALAGAAAWPVASGLFGAQPEALRPWLGASLALLAGFSSGWAP